MRSDKQNQASKENGRKSKGPVTEAGKANSARNAATHNLSTGHLILLSNEDPAEFHYHQAAFLQRFQPIDLVEYNLVQKIICAAWRERRIAAMESALFEIEMDRQKHDIDQDFEEIAPSGRHVLALFGATDATAASGLLLRYAAATRRAYADAYRLLKDLQGDRFNRPSRGVTIFAPPQDLLPLPPTEAAPEEANHTESPAPAAKASAASTTTQAIRIVRRIPLDLERAPNANEHPNHEQNAGLRNEPGTLFGNRGTALASAA